MPASARVDVVVAGAGPAGAAAALVLARHGRNVQLVDPGPSATRFKVGESLPGAARPLLRDLGVLDRVETGPHREHLGNLSAWGSAELRATDFLRDPHGLGWHLDRLRFEADLRAAAHEAGAMACTGHVRTVVPVDGGWRVDPGGIETRWLIDATGRQAAIARQLGARRHRDSALLAHCAWVRADDQDDRTLVEAVAEGWWYTARLPGDVRVVVLHSDEPVRDPETWREHLARTRHVHPLVGDVELLEGPRGAEACGARLDHLGAPGWLAVGDAALSFDPLSSQGLFNALYTGLRGAQAVDAALDGDVDTVPTYLDRLENVRRAYLEHHRVYYRGETRWSARPFWAKRHRSSELGPRPPSPGR